MSSSTMAPSAPAMSQEFFGVYQSMVGEPGTDYSYFTPPSMSGPGLEWAAVEKLMHADEDRFEEAVRSLSVRELLDLVSGLQSAMAEEQRRFDSLGLELQRWPRAQRDSDEQRALSAALCASQLKLARLCARNMRCFTQQAIRAKEDRGPEPKSGSSHTRGSNTSKTLTPAPGHVVLNRDFPDDDLDDEDVRNSRLIRQNLLDISDFDEVEAAFSSMMEDGTGDDPLPVAAPYDGRFHDEDDVMEGDYDSRDFVVHRNTFNSASVADEYNSEDSPTHGSPHSDEPLWHERPPPRPRHHGNGYDMVEHGGDRSSPDYASSEDEADYRVGSYGYDVEEVDSEEGHEDFVDNSDSYASDPRRYVYYPDEKELEVIPEEDEDELREQAGSGDDDGSDCSFGGQRYDRSKLSSAIECDSGVTDDQRSSCGEEEDGGDPYGLGSALGRGSAGSDPKQQGSSEDADSAQGSLLLESSDSPNALEPAAALNEERVLEEDVPSKNCVERLQPDVVSTPASGDDVPSARSSVSVQCNGPDSLQKVLAAQFTIEPRISSLSEDRKATPTGTKPGSKLAHLIQSFESVNVAPEVPVRRKYSPPSANSPRTVENGRRSTSPRATPDPLRSPLSLGTLSPQVSSSTSPAFGTDVMSSRVTTTVTEKRFSSSATSPAGVTFTSPVSKVSLQKWGTSTSPSPMNTSLTNTLSTSTLSTNSLPTNAVSTNTAPTNARPTNIFQSNNSPMNTFLASTLSKNVTAPKVSLAEVHPATNGGRNGDNYVVAGREALGSGDVIEEERVPRSSTLFWDPTELLKELYNVDAPQLYGREQGGIEYVNKEGYLDMMPSNRKKATYWNPWKRRFFRLCDGHLTCFESESSSRPFLKAQLMGGHIDTLENSMIGIDDRKGHYIAVKCANEREAESWLDAFHSQCQENFAKSFVQPVPRPPASHKRVIIVDMGGCSIRAGILMDQPTMPSVYFPSVCSTDRNTGHQTFGIEALTPEVRRSSHLTFPLVPSAKVSKFTMDVDALPGLMKKVFRDLGISNPSQYKLQICVPRSFSLQTQAALARVLLEELGVEALSLTHQAICALYAYNTTSGIVVDLGDRLDIVPITDGYIVEGGVTRLPYGAHKLAHHLRQALVQKRVSLFSDVDLYLVRYVQQQACYIAQNYSQELRRFHFDPDSVEKSLPVGHFFKQGCPAETVSLDVGRFQAPEGLFQPELWGLDSAGVHKLVQRALQECSMDIRREMARSIYLSGGLTLLPGFPERLQTELDTLTPDTVTPKVHASPYREHMAFLGASTMASTSAFDGVCVTLREWKEQGPACLSKWHL